jgi:hypothetical protein
MRPGNASHYRKGREDAVAFIFLVLFVILFLAWLFSFAIFHIAGGLIHILLALAIISIIVHFVRRAAGHRHTPVS